MLLPLTNTPRPYAWGSVTALASLQGRERTGLPEAELWLGDHPGSPATVGDGTGRTLDAWLADSGAQPLPYLLKVLAAAAPLSLQVHPSAEQGAAGFARENALGLALDAPERNYRDPCHKPEVIVALSEEFRALCGFRPLETTRRLLHALQTPGDASARAVASLLEMLSGGPGRDADGAGGAAEDADGAGTDGAGGADADAAAIGRTVRWLLSQAGPDVVGGIEDAIVASASASASTAATATAATAAAAEFAPELANARALAEVYPGDPGVAVSLLMNFVVLRAGEALWLPAGNLHAYMSGLGVELMAASDNVLRGGLTPKHIDVDELLRVLDTHALVHPRITPVRGTSPEIDVFAPGIPDFELLRVRVADAPVSIVLRGTAVALATEGTLTIRSISGETARIRSGEALLLSGETEVEVAGVGELFVAQAGA